MAKPRRGLRESRSSRYRPARAEADLLPAERARIDQLLQAAANEGLLDGKGARISGRVSPALIKQAKRMTGINSDTKLIEFALATIALEDEFPRVFAASHGTIDPTLKLGY
jgi:hypothetical protein